LNGQKPLYNLAIEYVAWIEGNGEAVAQSYIAQATHFKLGFLRFLAQSRRWEWVLAGFLALDTWVILQAGRAARDVTKPFARTSTRY
jgi:hypothetical protein